jgi:hypothetical protein
VTWGARVERERWLRIRVAAAAYAYEVEAKPIVDDATFDMLARHVRPQIMTGHPVFDVFFLTHFEPFTGAWVYRHPDLLGLKRICAKIRHYKFVRGPNNVGT